MRRINSICAVIGLTACRPSPLGQSLRRIGVLSSGSKSRVLASSRIHGNNNPFQQQIQKRHLRLGPTPDTNTSVSSNLFKMAPPYNKLMYYAAGTPNGLKPAIVLEELGIPYEVKGINIMTNEQKEPWYLEINPNGRIPALKDGDLRVFESGAVMLYLTDMYDKEKTLTYEHGTDLYYEMMSWLMFQMGGIGPMQGQANHFRAMAPVYSAYGIKRYLDETKRLYGVLEIRLSKADWLAGDKYTIADIANYSWVRAGPLFLDIDLSEFPGVDKWLKAIEKRDAVQRGRKVPPSSRTDEELLEMIKGMKARVDGMKGTEKDESSNM